jgi:hypothetical protein
MAQLHLAFTSPVTAVERNDEGKFSHQLRKLDHLAVLIGKLDIRESLSNSLIHERNLSEKNATFGLASAFNRIASIYRITARASMRAPQPLSSIQRLAGNGVRIIGGQIDKDRHDLIWSR